MEAPVQQQLPSLLPAVAGEASSAVAAVVATAAAAAASSPQQGITTTTAAASASASSPQQDTSTRQVSAVVAPTSCSSSSGSRKQRRPQPASKDTGGPHQQPEACSQVATGAPGGSAPVTSMAYQQKHALHRLKRLKKRAPHRDLVISFVPRLRTSIINRLDFFHRYSKQEQEVLSCFDFLDELIVNFCDGGTCESSPRHSQKLYQSMIYQLI